MFIEVHNTPNPNSLKFVPGIRIIDGSPVGFESGGDLAASPLAQSVLALDGIVGIFITELFVTVTKSPEVEWDALRPFILSTLQYHFNSGIPALVGARQAAANEGSASIESDTVRQIRDIIDEQIRPAVAQDGGDIIFCRYEGGVVYVQLRGACSGCPSSAMTLKSGVENMLRHYVPEVQSVEHVVDEL